ncbi:CAP domain-containing protein [Ferrimonas balearica]|uniref:CAP domain-containing protein n=1 Tax=Ferrimonas balearica TaxID=44012 RepID=UPI001C99C4B7|nr:CAP domain-containing protein [Ferrimonas balearica]MBY5991229.1 CAP domain-containing protein [Ferrimonas balearica]
MRIVLLLALLVTLPALGQSLSLSPIEAQVLSELNFARTEPQRYAREVLEPMRAHFRGTEIVEPPWRTRKPGVVQVVETQEGVQALEEAIDAMKAAQPVPALTPSYGLTLAARAYRKEQAKQGRIGHIGQDGSTPADRIERFGRWEGVAGENLFYGDGDVQVGRFVVMALIIDDGVADRGHRHTIMEAGYTLVGIAFGPHPLYGGLCVQNFAAEFYDAP